MYRGALQVEPYFSRNQRVSVYENNCQNVVYMDADITPSFAQGYSPLAYLVVNSVPW